MEYTSGSYHHSGSILHPNASHQQKKDEEHRFIQRFAAFPLTDLL